MLYAERPQRIDDGVDERGQRRAAARAEWFRSSGLPLDGSERCDEHDEAPRIQGDVEPLVLEHAAHGDEHHHHHAADEQHDGPKLVPQEPGARRDVRGAGRSRSTWTTV